MIPFPNDIMIEVTNQCNLRCITCYSHQDDREKKYMSMKVFQSIVDGIPDPSNKTISLYNYGEPLMHPDIGTMVTYAKKKHIHRIKIATNGTFLSPKKSLELIHSWLDFISISVDGTNQEIYEQFRIWGNLMKVLQNIRTLVFLRNRMASALRIEVQFIIMSHNESQVRWIESLCRTLGVDVLRYKTVLIKEKKWSFLLPKNTEYSRYHNETSLWSCQKPKEGIVVNVDGKVIPCCYITGEDIENFTFGNVLDQSIVDIFQTEENQKLVEQISSDKTNIRYCSSCNEWNQNLDFKKIYFD